MGWTTVQNGALLALASQHFDVFVTVDRNLSFQQNLIVLEAKRNRLADLRPLVPKLLVAIETAHSGAAKFIGAS